MGRNDSLQTEGPAHTVTINGFAMDKTEVTNAEYAQFVKQTNHVPPEQWGSVKPPLGQNPGTQFNSNVNGKPHLWEARPK